MIRAVTMTAAAVMMMTMMIAPGVGIVPQRSGGQRLGGLVRAALNTGVELNARVGQRRFRAHTDAPANQSVHFGRLKETGQRAVTASVCIHDLLPDNSAFLRVIDFEPLGMPEMLKNLSVFVCNGDSH